MQNKIKNQFGLAINLDEIARCCAPLQLPNLCYENLSAKDNANVPYVRYLTTLKKFGVLIISLAYTDQGETLKNIVKKIGILHKHTEHESFIWDIKVATENSVKPYLARSHQADEFYLHTDCSYEKIVPDYFGLYVLKPDQFGGGKNLIVHQQDLLSCLSKSNLSILQNYPVTIKVPKEFYKGIASITAPIIDEHLNLRYRREIIDLKKLTLLQKKALHEFETLAYSTKQVRNLSLKKNQILLLNNKKYLHARTAIKDKNRHLKRIRFFIKN